MAATRMRADEIDTDAALVRRLLVLPIPWAESRVYERSEFGTSSIASTGQCRTAVRARSSRSGGTSSRTTSAVPSSAARNSSGTARVHWPVVAQISLSTSTRMV
jgi:hypothetical protein